MNYATLFVVAAFLIGGTLGGTAHMWSPYTKAAEASVQAYGQMLEQEQKIQEAKTKAETSPAQNTTTAVVYRNDRQAFCAELADLQTSEYIEGGTMVKAIAPHFEIPAECY
ncbi:MAG: hypothetical protein WC926_03930 [Candidatus Paceibacterota bacterium]|jgi:hypothetical protein